MEVQIKATLNRGDPTISPEADGIKVDEKLLQLAGVGVVVAQILQRDLVSGQNSTNTDVVFAFHPLHGKVAHSIGCNVHQLAVIFHRPVS